MFKSRWLIFLPVVALALFMPTKVHATQVGLIARGYLIGNDIPPVMSDLAYPLCGSDIVPFINVTFDYPQNLFGDCGWDQFMIHYTGFLQIPEHQTIEFWVASDDGGMAKIGTEQFGVWQDQGCSATESGPLNLDAGTAVVDFYFYENGGGTCAMLAWNIDGTGWEIIQPEYFTSEPLTTATTEPPPTDPSTTIEPSTTSTLDLPNTAGGQQATTSTQATISSNPTSSTVWSTTTEPSVPSTQLEIPVATPTTYEETTTTLEETTTTLADIPETTVELSPVTTDAIAEETTTTVEEVVVEPTNTLLPIVEEEQPLTAEEFVLVLSALTDATPEEVSAIIDEVLEADLSTDQATQLVASPEVLSAITGEQAQQLFDSVEPTQLSDAMAAVISDALNSPDVPTEVKQAFETSINIFGKDGFANYVPVGSAVSVAVRRVIIAGVAAVSIASAGSAVRRGI